MIETRSCYKGTYAAKRATGKFGRGGAANDEFVLNQEEYDKAIQFMAEKKAEGKSWVDSDFPANADSICKSDEVSGDF
jgi:hypothetical protein